MRFKDKKEAREVNSDKLIRPNGVSDEQWTRALDLYEVARMKGDKFPELTVAQAALETGWFKHMSGNYNYFGQKASKFQKGTQKLTSEYDNNRKFIASEKFRDYGSLEESMDDRMTKWGSKYKDAANIDEAIQRIWSYDPKTGKGKGYATDINYDNKLGKILKMMGVDTSMEVKESSQRSERSLLPQSAISQLPTVQIDNTAVANRVRDIEPLFINTPQEPEDQGQTAVAEARNNIEKEQNKLDFIQMVISASQVQFIEPVQTASAQQVFQDGGDVDLEEPVEKSKVDAEKPIEENVEEIARVYRRKNSRVLRELEFRLPASYSTKIASNEAVNEDGLPLAQDGREVVRESTLVRSPNLDKRFQQIQQVLNPDNLEEEEQRLRNRRPEEQGFLEKSADFVSGNFNEFIGNPIKEQISSLLPETFQSDRELRTSRSRFDNTEDVRPYLLDNKSIAEIRKEKNISFNQVSQNTDKNALIPLNLKRRIVNSVYPQGYTPEPESFIKRFKSEESQGDEQIKRLKGVLGDNREDIFLMYSGLPQRHDTFTVSSFKAGEKSDTNITFKDPKKVMSYLKTAALRTDLFDKLANGEITPDVIKQERTQGLRGAEKSNKASFRDPQNVMWNATFGIGYDKTGQPYLSFYDNWDLAGKDDYPVVKDIFGSPIEIYDRIPLTDDLIKGLAKVKKVAQSDSASDSTTSKDVDKQIQTEFNKRFNTAEIKRELLKISNQIKKRLQ